mgnify:CR=1 FL=1
MNKHKKYWENNIEGFSGFYDTTSEETIQGNKLFAWLYKHIVFPMEKKYMQVRHKMVSDFIDEHIMSGSVVADIGCGSGIYSKKMAALVGSQGKVHALDFTAASIKLVNNNLSGIEKAHVVIQQFDIVKEHIPNVDIAISIGVLPYIDDLNVYLKNIIPYTNKVYFNFLDADHWLNKVRRYLPFLNARDYSYHAFKDIQKYLEEAGFSVETIQVLATGKMIYAKKI